MRERSPRLEEIFFEVFEPLPRQGPGNHACAARALGLWRELPLEAASQPKLRSSTPARKCANIASGRELGSNLFYGCWLRGGR